MGNDEKETEGNQTQEENKVPTQVLTNSWEKNKIVFRFYTIWYLFNWEMLIKNDF